MLLSNTVREKGISDEVRILASSKQVRLWRVAKGEREKAVGFE